MAPLPIKTLFLEDISDELNNFLRLFAGDASPYSFAGRRVVGTVAEAKAALAADKYDLIILDLKIGDDFVGEELLKYVREQDALRFQPLIILTNYIDRDLQRRLIDLGADGFLSKGGKWDDARRDGMRCIIERSLEMGRLRADHLQHWGLERKPTSPEANDGMCLYGTTPKMRAVFNDVIRIAAVEDPNNNVLILGPTGTGKTTIADIIQAIGPRRDRPYEKLVLNTLPPGLLESELFGIEDGVVLGSSKRIGLIEKADGGVLFLDEIGELPLDLQVKLLQVLRERRVQTIGSRKFIDVDFQLICATNADLEQLVEERRFRADLYHRIRGSQITLPSLGDLLAENPDELSAMIAREQDHLRALGSYAGFWLDETATQYLQTFPWTGNYAQFRTLMRNLSLLSCEAIDLAIVQSGLAVTSEAATIAADADPIARSLEIADYDDATRAFQEEHVTYWLQRFHGDVEKTAEHIGVNPATVYRILKRIRSRSPKSNQP